MMPSKDDDSIRQILNLDSCDDDDGEPLFRELSKRLPHIQIQVLKRVEKIPNQNDAQECPDSSQLFCLICEDPADFIENGFGGGTSSDDDEVKQLMTLCKHMMPMNQDDIPKEICQKMFPLCPSCKGLAKELWELEVRMEKIKNKIEDKVVEEVNSTGLDLTLLPKSDNTEKRFMKLRTIIYEGYLNKLRLKKPEGLAVRKTGRGTAATPSPLNITSNSSEWTPLTVADGHSSTTEQRMEMDEDESGSSQLPSCDVDSNVPDDSRAEPVVNVGEESRCGPEEGEFDDPLFEEEYTTLKVEIPTVPDEENIPQKPSSNTNTRTPEGTLLVHVEGADININWTRCTSTNESFMECSFLNCTHSVPFGTNRPEWKMANKSMKIHVLENHEEETDQLALDQRGKIKKKETPFCLNFPYCLLWFADPNSLKKHEEVHPMCSLWGKRFCPTETKMNPSLSDYMAFPQKSKKRKATDGGGDQAASSSKKRKN